MTNEGLVDKRDTWDFIVARHRALTPHESTHLHDLQGQQGMDIVLHLFQQYAALRLGRSLAPDRVAAAAARIAGWRPAVFLPLRRLRRVLKDPSGFASGQQEMAQALRARIAGAELEAEQAELRALCYWLSSRAPLPPCAEQRDRRCGGPEARNPHAVRQSLTAMGSIASNGRIGEATSTSALTASSRAMFLQEDR